MTGFNRPNYTQTPNELFDSFMRDMTEAELKITLVAIRKILGFHKTKPEPISLTQFQEMSGLSRQAAEDGVNAALARGLLREAGRGGRGVRLFDLVFNEVDQSTEATSLQNRPVTGLQNRPDDGATGLESRHTKEKESKENKKEKAAAGDAEVFKVYHEEIGIVSAMTRDFLKDAVAEYGAEWCMDAIREAVLAGVRKPKYVASILARWKREGRGATSAAARGGSAYDAGQTVHINTSTWNETLEEDDLI